MNKLRWGVLRLMTPVGPRYFRPSILERIYLLWVFRHFDVLPQQVLSGMTSSLIENLCARSHLASNDLLYSITEQPVIGTVERLLAPDGETARDTESVGSVRVLSRRET